MPEHTARPAAQALAGLSPDLVGAVFSIQGRWGFFVPEESDVPRWPAGIRYLKAGVTVTLPPACWKRPWTGTGPGWVHRPAGGRLLTPPLLLHPMVSAVSHPAPH